MTKTNVQSTPSNSQHHDTPNNKTHVIKFRVTAEEKASLELTCKLLNLSLSTFIRRAIHNVKIEKTVIVAGGGEETRPGSSFRKKGNTWHFGYKAHVGVDHETGIVHSLEVTSTNKHDVCMVAELLTGEEQLVYRDSGYLGAEKRTEAVTRNKYSKRIHYKINRRPSQSKHSSNRSRARIKRREREKASVRSKVEHVFAVVKQ